MHIYFSKFLIGLVFFIGCSNVYGQNNFSIVEGDSTMVSCTNPCLTLHGNFLKKKATNDYVYSTIPFAASTLTSAATLALGDDNFSAAIPIGFDFCFYNQLYSTVYISSNGVLTFGSTYANGSCSFDTKTPIPYYNSTYADASIFGPFIDLKPSAGGVIRYQTTGVTPNRKFIVQYDNLKLFGATCANTTSTFEIVLYELSNYVDVQITNKAVCDADTANYLNFATIGVQSIAANNYLTINGKNASIWTANNVGYRFSPNGLPNYTVLWKEGNSILGTNPDSLFFCAGANSHTVLATITYTCPSIILEDSIVIRKPSLGFDSISLVLPTCKYSTNGSVSVYTNNINLPHTYSVDNSPFTSNNIFTGLDTGEHYVIAKDAAGCIVNSTVVLLPISNLELLSDSISESGCDDSIADGYVSVMADFGILPYAYLWNTGITGPVINNALGNTVYTCTVTDLLGCIDSLLSFIPKYQITIIIDSLKNATCPNNNGYIAVHGINGTSPYTYLWTNGDTTNIIDSLAPNNYNVTVTDSAGCFKTTTIIVGQDSLPAIFATSTPNICDSNNGTISTTVISNNTPISYLWNTGATTSGITNLGDGTYSVLVTDSKGCTANTFLVIKDTFSVKSTHTASGTKCGLANGSASVNPYNGFAPYTFFWNYVPNTTASVTNLPSGLNICTITDANGCVGFDTILIAASQSLQASGSLANANCDVANGSIVMSMQNGVPPFTYNWNNGQTTNTASGLAANQFYIVTITDFKNCVFKDTFFIQNDGKPYLNVTSFFPPICHGDSTGSATLQGYQGVSPYKYSLDGVNFSTSAVISNIPGGTITIFVKDANSCINDTTITLPQPPLLLYNYKIPDTLICYNSKADTVTMNTSGGYPPYSYALDNGAFSSSNVFDNLSIGSYTISIKDSVNCIKKTFFEIIGPSKSLQVQFTKKDVPCFEKNTGALEAFVDGGWPPYNYLWSNGNTVSKRDSLEAKIYDLLITDTRGCEIATAINVKQLSCCICIVPEAFTPNGDLLNDDLKLIGAGSNFTEFLFAIYNRQGQKVFETGDINMRWDGKLSDRDLPTETYYYYLKFKCASEDNVTLQKGAITLIR